MIESGQKSDKVLDSTDRRGSRQELHDERIKELKAHIRVLTVCLSHSWGGLEQVAASDSQDLAEQGVNVRVLCIKDSPIFEKLKSDGRVAVEAIDFKPRDYFDFKLRQELFRLQDESGINLVHTHQTTLLGSMTPWFWNRHEMAILASRHIMNNHNKRNPFHAFIYRRLDGLVVMSETLRKNVLETHPLRERQVRVIRLGLNFDRFNPALVDRSRQRADWKVDDDTIVIGMVGRIDPAKGQSVFVKAAAGLMKPKEGLPKMKFVIVGEKTKGADSEYMESLEKMIEQFRLKDHFVFAGFQENIPEVMRAFDIFIMPSRQEAFGLVAIEAMAMECPVIISRGGSAQEIVGTDEDSQAFGLLVRPEDAFDLQRQIRTLLLNPGMRERMGIAGRKHVLETYDRRVRVERTLDLYERLTRLRRIIKKREKVAATAAEPPASN